MNAQKMTQRQVAGLIGIDESVLSKRLRKGHTATFEALIVINLVREFVMSEKRKRRTFSDKFEFDSYAGEILRKLGT